VLFSFRIGSREVGLRTGETERDPNSNICVCCRHTHTHTHRISRGVYRNRRNPLGTEMEDWEVERFNVTHLD